MPRVKVGDPIPLQLQLPDGDTGQYVQVHLHDNTGTPLAGSPFALTHILEGSYEDVTTVLMPDTPLVMGTFEVYKDAGFTKPNLIYCDASEIWEKNQVLDKVCAIQTIVTSILAGAAGADLEGILIENGGLEGILEDCGG